MEISALDGSGDIVIDEPWQEVTKWPQGHRECEKSRVHFGLLYSTRTEMTHKEIFEFILPVDRINYINIEHRDLQSRG